MQHEALKTEYLCYLMNLAQIKAEGPDGYLELCKILLDTHFIPVVDFDENRCEDCQQLRYRFAEPFDQNDNALYLMLPLSGTFMELLVVLTERFMFETASSKYEASPDKWFKEMLHNCGLDIFTNELVKSMPGNRWDSAKAQIADILTGINMRWFNWDGEGSFFPLKQPHNDQRYQEIIVQMNNYIEENYDLS